MKCIARATIRDFMIYRGSKIEVEMFYPDIKLVKGKLIYGGDEMKLKHGDHIVAGEDFVVVLDKFFFNFIFERIA